MENKTMTAAARSVLFGLLFVAVLASGKNPPNMGERVGLTWEELQADFAEPDMMYAPAMFWFWDEPLEVEKMAEMARVMCEQGFNPGYAHARRAVVAGPGLPDEQWLADVWFDAFGAALNEAEKEGCYLGYCDEYWWPSMQAHGRVLRKFPELRAQSLNWQIIDAKASEQVNVPASFFAVAAQVGESQESRLLRETRLGNWIWHPQARPNSHTCLFRKSFEIPSDKAVKRAIAAITADNSLAVYLNGIPVGENDDWTEVSFFDITGSILPGGNILAVEAKNIDGEFGLIAGLTVEFEDGELMKIKSDDTWLSSLSAESGFEQIHCDTSKWASVSVIANAGDGPWNSVNNQRPVTILSKTLRVIGSGDAFIWQAPAGGTWRVYAFNKYYQAGVDGGEVNCIDERLADAFIGIALEPYAKRMGDKLGKSIPGDFIDNEGDYGRQLAWSDSLKSCFKERFGQDIRLVMPVMIDKDAEGLYAKVRWQWFDLVSDLYAGNFRAVTDWHEQRGMFTTAHVWEEGLVPQLHAVGDHMKFLRSFTMPGQDCLGARVLRVHDFKECVSVAEFEDKRSMTELMGFAGFETNAWGTYNPTFLKQAANAVTAWGISHVIPHGVFTNRQLDGNPWPPDWYSDSPMYPYMHLWTDFMRRASYVNSMGHAEPDVLLYNPMESVWINANAGMLDGDLWSLPSSSEGGRRINEIDEVYCEAIDELTEWRIEFLVGDRFYLNQMEVINAKLVRGGFAFGSVVLPPLDILTLDVAEKFLNFAKAGGRLYALGELPASSVENGINDPAMVRIMDELKQQQGFYACTDGIKQAIEKKTGGLESPVQFVSGEFAMIQQRRLINGRDFYWLANNSLDGKECEVLVRGAQGAAFIWDCASGRIKRISSAEQNGATRLKLSFKPLEGYWLAFDPSLRAGEVPADEPVKPLFAVEGPWKVSYVAAAQPEMEHKLVPPAEFVSGVEKPLEDWRNWTGERFSGLLDYEKTVRIERLEPLILLDLGKVCAAAEVWVNGKPVGEKLWGPYVFDISGAVQIGDNEVKIRVANLISNSYGIIEESGMFGPVHVRIGEVIELD